MPHGPKGYEKATVPVKVRPLPSEQPLAPFMLPLGPGMPKAAALVPPSPQRVIGDPSASNRYVLLAVHNHLHLLLDLVTKELTTQAEDLRKESTDTRSGDPLITNRESTSNSMGSRDSSAGPRVGAAIRKPVQADAETTLWSDGDEVEDTIEKPHTAVQIEKQPLYAPAERYGAPMKDLELALLAGPSKSMLSDVRQSQRQSSTNSQLPKSRSKMEEQFFRLDKYKQGRLTAEDCADIMSRCLGYAHELAKLEQMIRYLNVLASTPNPNRSCSAIAGSEDVRPALPDVQSGLGDVMLESGNVDTSISSYSGDHMLCIGLEAYDWLMNSYKPGLPGEQIDLTTLRLAFRKDIQMNFQELNLMLADNNVVRSDQPRGVVGLLLDTIPALMILLNAVVMGVQQDVSPNSGVWQVTEMYFYVFFLAEFLIKIWLIGLPLFIGPDRLWNYFDMFCILTGSVDLIFTHLVPGDKLAMVNVMYIKILRLARLGRLVRLLRFKIFHELKMMVQGVVSGMRVLCWAIVLLLFVVFLLAIICRSMLADMPEFATVFRAMFSLFRCFTDGCTAYNGTPLQERLREDYGPILMIAYILVFLFVTIGIFNLIMAIFIDNVVTAHIQRKQHELGENASKMEVRINEVIAKRFEACRQLHHQSKERDNEGQRGASQIIYSMTDAGKQSDWEKRKQEASDIIAENDEDIVITKDVFNTWLNDREMLDLLEEVEVETSTKYELFDALDVDSGGELTVEELVSGLMKLRGPVSKNDIVATRLKVAYITELIEDICRKMGIELSCDGSNAEGGTVRATIANLDPNGTSPRGGRLTLGY